MRLISDSFVSLGVPDLKPYSFDQSGQELIDELMNRCFSLRYLWQRLCNAKPTHHTTPDKQDSGFHRIPSFKTLNTDMMRRKHEKLNDT